MTNPEPQHPYLAVLAIAMAFGALKYIRSLETHSRFLWTAFFTKVIVSGFAGVLAYWIGSAAGLQWPLLAAVTGIAGSMGGDFIDSLEDSLPNALTGKINKK